MKWARCGNLVETEQLLRAHMVSRTSLEVEAVATVTHRGKGHVKTEQREGEGAGLEDCSAKATS